MKTKKNTFTELEQATAVELAKQSLWAELRGFWDEYRERHNLSLEDLAARIGVPKSQVHRWLSGPSNVTIKSAARLALAMEADLSVKPISWDCGVKEEEAAGRQSAHSPVTFAVPLGVRAYGQGSAQGACLGTYLAPVSGGGLVRAVWTLGRAEHLTVPATIPHRGGGAAAPRAIAEWQNQSEPRSFSTGLEQ